ncbi:hypothetical protein HQQ94_14870 [Shewanella sp. VB17]|uniref:hypothetical protein n=1 Tax=Shewanella sp. VB17 TaxID=2739432 RepID=UPI001566C2FF|nr:hypothetical protein [Shewanella sp. VB17]NRD74495.1 hypothetical protein [Shewanella sp. VB17]
MSTKQLSTPLNTFSNVQPEFMLCGVISAAVMAIPLTLFNRNCHCYFFNHFDI